MLTAVLVASACSGATPSTSAPSQASGPPGQQSASATQVASIAVSQSPGTAEESPAIPGAPQQFQDYVASVQPAEKDYGGVEVTVVVDSIQTGEPFFWLTPAIEKRYGIKLRVLSAPFETYYQSILNDLVSGAGQYDILNYPPRFLGDLAAGGNVVPLDNYATQWDPQLDDVFPVYRELYTKWQGQLVALPFDGDRLELYYRKDLFNNADEKAAFKQKYGRDLAVPQTWDDYLQVAEFFTRKPNETLAGAAMPEGFAGMAEITKLPDNFDWFLNRFASYGGVYFDAQMNPQIDTDAGHQALQNFVDAVKFGPSDILNYEYPESFAAFLEGRVAMCIQWTDVARVAEDPATSKVVGNTGYAQVPGALLPDGTVRHRSALAYGRVDSISKLSKNQEAAYRVIQFMNQPDVALLYTTEPTAGIDPYRPSTYNDPSKWVQQWPALADYIANNKLSIENGYPEITMPGSTRYDDSLGQHVANALAGQETVDQALKAVTDEWNGITDDLGRDTQTQYWQTQLTEWQQLGLVKP